MSNATSLYSMFDEAASFNQPLEWNVSKVTSFERTFSRATSFDQDITGWDTSNGISFHSCFVVATSFNQDVSSWNIQSAESLKFMFAEAKSFNQDMDIWGSLYIGNKIVDTSAMFRRTSCPVTSDPEPYGSYCHCNPDLTRRQCRQAVSAAWKSAQRCGGRVLLVAVAVTSGMWLF